VHADATMRTKGFMAGVPAVSGIDGCRLVQRARSGLMLSCFRDFLSASGEYRIGIALDIKTRFTKRHYGGKSEEFRQREWPDRAMFERYAGFRAADTLRRPLRHAFGGWWVE
jgi:hypothetical protein